MPINNPLAITPGKTKIKSETKDMTEASGDVSYTGYGFKPDALVVFACIDGAVDVVSWGVADEALADEAIQQLYDPKFADAPSLVFLTQGLAVRQDGVLKSFDADGFTLTWTKNGATSGSAKMTVLALRMGK